MRRLWVKQIQNTKERFVNICENKDLSCKYISSYFLSCKFIYDHEAFTENLFGGCGGWEILTLLHPDFETLSSVCTFFSTQNCFVK